MKTIATALVSAALLGTAATLFAAESSTPPPPAGMPPMPEPTQEHAWLQQFVGEWESEAEVMMAPNQPPLQCTGSESVRPLGGFWIIAEGIGQMPGMPEAMKSRLTLGYDVEKRKYVGTWVDSMTGTLWLYVGTVDASGRKLTLEAEGPSPTKPGTTARFRDVTEFTSRDERIFSSSMQNEDGTWTTFIKGKYRRKK